MSQHMRALTLASAKHLLNAGHITPQHHARIVKASAAPKMATMPHMPKRPAAAGMLKQPGQQAQAPVPGFSSPAAVPAGTSTGYDDDGGSY